MWVILIQLMNYSLISIFHGLDHMKIANCIKMTPLQLGFHRFEISFHGQGIIQSNYFF